MDGVRGVVASGDLLEMIKRLVFLSVPQWGTNLADWVRNYTLGREIVVAEMRAFVEASQVPLLDQLQEWISSSASTVARLGLVYAIRDVLSEAEADTSRKPMRILLAQEAASEIQLWLRHITSDFAAIDDPSRKF